MLRTLLLGACVSALATSAFAQADPDAPKGRLPATVVPTAYTLDLTVLPDQPHFTGHVEIDVDLKVASRKLYMDGRDLQVSKAVALVKGAAIPAAWTQVDPTGVVRLDFPSTIPAGRIRLAFDYQGTFGQTPSGLYHIKVGGQWYSWSQFESIDARAAYPSFDEPGFKTPFTISITTRKGFKTVSNAPEVGVTAAGELETHRFAPTKPLPTYLVAMDTGPFLHPTSAVPPDAERDRPLPLGAVATQAQAGKLDYVLAETPRIVSLLEGYFGQPFPFPKLDQIASPEMPGAMENAGADTYADEIILLDHGATTRARQEFGMVVGHELSHQWFGDLVTPAWWDDIWLNESFANWMGYRIGNAWRPELNIGVGALSEGYAAMDTDALEVGRPIHQHIATNADIDAAFDSITYGKGGQVVAMIAAYMGDERFRDGVRLHLSRHRYGNATTEQFFGALADAAGDPRILQSMRSFVDQPGVPLVTFARGADGALTASQSRYAFYRSTPPAEQWAIPLCLDTGGGARSCMLLDRASMPVTAPGGVLMPNAGGTGYYRFELPAQDWRALIAAAPGLPAGEALAADDSLWASFRAGRAPAASLTAELRTMAANPDSNVSVAPGHNFEGLRLRGVIEGPALADYRRMMDAVYAPKLATLGLDPSAGIYAAEAPDRQKLRQDVAALVVEEARDPRSSAVLAAAARKYLAGDKGALDQAFMEEAFVAEVREGGVPAAQAMTERALVSEDAVFRSAALDAVGGSGRPDVAAWLLAYRNPKLRLTERLDLVLGMARKAETRDMAGDWLLAHYNELAATGANGVFFTSRLPSAFRYQCSAARADQVERVLGPKVRALGAGVLDFERTVEQIRHCGDLKTLRQADLAEALARTES